MAFLLAFNFLPDKKEGGWSESILSYDLGVRFVTAGKCGSGNGVHFGSRRVRLLARVWMDWEAEWGGARAQWQFSV